MYKIRIPQRQVQKAISSEWNTNAKRNFYGSTDGKSRSVVKQNIDAGNLGEQAVYLFLRKMNVPCLVPNFSKIEDHRGKWKDDVILQKSVGLIRNGKKIDCGTSVNVKGQYVYRGERYGYSWVFQKHTYKYSGDVKRQGDPLLYNSKRKEVLAVVILHAKEDLYENPTDVPADIRFFYWPDVAPHIGEMKKADYRDQKAALYLKDIEKFELSFEDFDWTGL